MKITVVTPIPTPYRDPFWSEVARQPEVDLTVFYCSAGKCDRPWEASWEKEFHAEVLPGRNLARWKSADASCYWNPGIVDRLKAGQFDAIIVGGYNHITMWQAMKFAKKNGIPYYLMCETYRRSNGKWWKQRIKDRLVRWVVRNAAGGFPTGVLAEEYLVHYGAQPESLMRLPNVPDVVRLQSEGRRLRPQRHDLKTRHNLDERPVVLFVGRLIPKKRAELLIRAFHQSEIDAQLVIVGDGPLRSHLEQIVLDLNMQGDVHFAGFVQPAEMPTWYSMADLFVLPSSETWGVVVLEAIASGLPVIVSDEVGCHPDVVSNPKIGDVVPAGDIQALSNAVIRRISRLSGVSEVNYLESEPLQIPGYEALSRRMNCFVRNQQDHAPAVNVVLENHHANR